MVHCTFPFKSDFSNKIPIMVYLYRSNKSYQMKLILNTLFINHCHFYCHFIKTTQFFYQNWWNYFKTSLSYYLLMSHQFSGFFRTKHKVHLIILKLLIRTCHFYYDKTTRNIYIQWLLKVHIKRSVYFLSNCQTVKSHFLSFNRSACSSEIGEFRKFIILIWRFWVHFAAILFAYLDEGYRLLTKTSPRWCLVRPNTIDSRVYTQDFAEFSRHL